MRGSMLAKLSIVDLLAVILGGQFACKKAPTEKVSNKDHIRGVITSDAAKKLFAAHECLEEYMLLLENRHIAWHNKYKSEQICKCLAFNRRLRQIEARQEILYCLFLQAILEEFPQIIGYQADIREGWTLVSEKWNDKAVVDPTKGTGNYISVVRGIVCGSKNRVECDKWLKPVSMGEEIIGILNDGRVHGFCALDKEIHDQHAKIVPGGMTDSTVLDKLTVKQLKELACEAYHLKFLSEVTSAIFWCGIRDLFADVAGFARIGIRKGWKVVATAPVSLEGTLQSFFVDLDGKLEKN